MKKYCQNKNDKGKKIEHRAANDDNNFVLGITNDKFKLEYFRIL